MHIFSERKKILSERLLDNAGEDLLKDRYNCGYIAACYDILNIDVEEVAVDD